MPVQLESLVVEIRRDINADILLRVGRAMEHLVGLIQEAYAKEFTASHGAAGAIGAISYEVKNAKDFIEATIGLADSAKYLRNLEFGERGTDGGPSGGALFSRTRAPRVRTIYEWLQLAKLTTPQYFKDRAARFKQMATSGHAHPSFDKNRDKPWYSTDPLMQFAFAIAMKRKRYGRRALHVIERTTRSHAKTITDYLQQA